MKTRLFTRKRALISSVAMLLVAMVALGTATFAWFTKSSSATAGGVTVRTVKASDLKIQNSKSGWVDSFSYGFDDTLKPASSANGADWFTAEAKEKDKYNAADVNATDISSKIDWAVKTANSNGTATATNTNGYVFKEQLNIKNEGDAAINNVKIKFSLAGAVAMTTGRNYLRVAVVPVSSRGADPTADDFNDGVYAGGNDTAAAFTNISKATSTVTATSAAGTAEVSVANKLTKNEEKFFNIYVWFEGQDTDCYDLNAGNYINNLSFSVVGEASEA